MKYFLFLALLFLTSCVTDPYYSDNDVGTAAMRTLFGDGQFVSAQDVADDRFNSMYGGNCPCPYSVAADGSRCGARSAYSRSGGASPICY